MMFGPTITDPEAKALWGELEKNQKEQIKKVTDACEAVNKERNADAEVTFKMEVGEPSPSPKHDLVNACYDFNADCLVVGSRGLAHSLKETTSKFMHEHVIGSVPDFCADNAPCDVFIVKPKEY
jgi:nucleotide-binding universal stress UspA family protein